MFDRNLEVQTISNTSAVGERAGKPLVLLANEPRAYRESIAQVFAHLRPGVEVMTAEPDELTERVLSHGPVMVVCSEATGVVRERVPFWVELYPGYESRSVVSLEGRRSTIEEIELSDLLAVLDRAERLAQRS